MYLVSFVVEPLTHSHLFGYIFLGAYSYYGGYNYETTREIFAGDELFTSYGMCVLLHLHPLFLYLNHTL